MLNYTTIGEFPPHFLDMDQRQVVHMRDSVAVQMPEYMSNAGNQFGHRIFAGDFIVRDYYVLDINTLL
jgi:hypothetical protein